MARLSMVFLKHVLSYVAMPLFIIVLHRLGLYYPPHSVERFRLPCIGCLVYPPGSILVTLLDVLIRFWEELIHEARNTDSLRDEIEPSSLAALIHCTWLGAITCRELETPGFRLDDIAQTLHGLISNPKH